MKVAVANPFCWPEIRRGGERLQQDLCTLYDSAGHATTLLSSAPAGLAPEHPEGVTPCVLTRRPALPPLYDFAHLARRHLAQTRYDALHALTHFEAGAALTLRRRPRVIAHTIGAPTLRMFRRRPLERWLLHRAMRRADEVAVLSRYAHDRLAADLPRRIHILPPAVDLDRFAPGEGAAAPNLLFVGDVTETRKNAALTLAAFASLAADHPDLTLALSGHVTPQLEAQLRAGLDPRLAARVRFLGLGTRDDLPGLYRQASVLVLPAAFEAFGLVLTEALACGTPVIGAVPGGAADIIDSPGIGRLIDITSTTPLADLTRAMRETLDLAQDSATPARCRARAQAFGWSELGPRYLDVLEGRA